MLETFTHIMKPPGLLLVKANGSNIIGNWRFIPYRRRVFEFRRSEVRFPVSTTNSSRPEIRSILSPVSVIGSDVRPETIFQDSSYKLQALEEHLEKAIYGCRFLAFMGVWGSLFGSLLCFIKGCTYVWSSYMENFLSSAKAVPMLIEAIDIYLIGTVMLVFGMGLYELFVSNLDIAKSLSTDKTPHRSNLFGLFTLTERPKWLEIKSVNELKTKLGHVIVMVLLVGLFEKSTKVVITSATDLLCFSVSILLSSVCLLLLSKLNNFKQK